MAIQPGIWGIDLGQCALKALRVELQDDQVIATAFDYVEHPKILSQPDADPDQLTREALEKFLSRNTMRGDIVAISVPGQSGLARFVKLPPVEEKKIVDIVKFEAKQQIPFNLDEVVWDYQKISTGIVTDGFAMETEIGLFAMKRDMVNRYLQHFKDVNVEVHVVQMAPLCLCNYLAYDLLGLPAEPEALPAGAKKQAIVALDIGTDSSNLVVTDGRRIIWQRPIPLGGNHFTRALTKELKLTFAKAEHLKRNATKSGPELKKILTALKPVLNDFVGEVQRSLGYFTNTHRDAQVEYMVGLGSAFRLPGLQRFLAEKLQLDVRKLQKLERLTGDSVVAAPAFTENVLSFAVAYGLALQGLKVTRLHTNLLPAEIQQERLIRAKKPWAVAAAAALLAGTFFGPYLGLALDFRSVNTEASPLKEAMAKSDTVIKRDGSLKSAFDAKEKATKDEETAVRSIIAGLDERLNWIRLIQFLSDALPRPDGYNLSKAAWDEFYIKKGGQDALGRLQRRLGMAKSDASSALADIDPALIQFNIEALDARYTEDLAAVWTRLKEDPYRIPKEDVRPVGQYDNPPKEKEKGWVVELRGFTYNNGGRRFVLEGLVDALATRGIKQAPAPTTPSGSDPKATPAPPPTGSPESSTASTSSDTKEPVLDRISHVVLLKVTEPDNGGEELTKNGKVDTLVTTSFRSLLGSGGGMPGMGSFAGGPMVGQSSASRSGGGPKFSAMTPGAPSSGSGSSPSRSPITTPTPGSMGSGGPATMQGGSSRGGRTDFIVLFFWREPAPSDQYLPPRPEEPQGGQMGPGGPMGPMGPMGPPSGIMGGSSTMPGGK